MAGPTCWYRFSGLATFPLVVCKHLTGSHSREKRGFVCLFALAYSPCMEAWQQVWSFYKKRVGRKWVGHQAPKSSSSDLLPLVTHLLPPGRHQVIKAPQSSITVPPPGDQIFKHMILWSICHSKFTTYTYTYIYI